MSVQEESALQGRQQEESCADKEEGAPSSLLPQEQPEDDGAAAGEESFLCQNLAARQTVLYGVPCRAEEEDADDEHGAGGGFGQHPLEAALAMALKRPEEGAAFGDERERGEIEEGEVGVVAVGGHVFHGFFTSHFVALFLSADVRSASFSVMCVVTQREMA